MLAVLVIIGLLTYFIYWQFYGKRQGLPPGPMPMPIVGNMLTIDFLKLHRQMKKYSDQYGPVFTLWLGADPCVMITDYSIMKECMIKNGESFAGRPYFYTIGLTLAEDNIGLFNNQGPQWKEQKRFTLQVLKDLGLGKNMLEQKAVEHVGDLIEHITELMEGESKKQISIDFPIDLCVGNIALSLIMNQTWNRNDGKFIQWRDMLQKYIKLLVSPTSKLLNANPWLRFVPMWDHFNYDSLLKAGKEIQEYVNELVKEAKQKYEPESEPNDFLSFYMKEIEKRKNGRVTASADIITNIRSYSIRLIVVYKRQSDDNCGYTDPQMAAIFADIMAGGISDPINTLRWIVLYLLHHQDVQEKCRQEIDSHLESTGDRFVTSKDRKDLPFTVATLYEAQRMNDSIPLNQSRTITAQSAKVGPYVLPRGTQVTPQFPSLNMDEKIFADPERFDPQAHFLDEMGKLRNIEEYIPFSLGKRSCPGEGLARMQMFIIIANLIHKFRLHAPDPLPDFTPGNIDLNPTPKVYQVLVEAR